MIDACGDPTSGVASEQEQNVRSEEVNMGEMTRLLVVANRTADSDELFAALRDRAEHDDVRVTMLVPQDSHGGMGRRLNAALRRLHDADIEAEGMLGDVDPCISVDEFWDASRFDEVYVSTLPEGESHWMDLDMPARVERITGAVVHHVIATERAATVAS
jgi:hypothetical protein